MKKPGLNAPPIYEVPSRHRSLVYWQGATFVLLGVVIAQHFVYQPGILLPSKAAKKHSRLVLAEHPLSADQEANLQKVASLGGTVHYDRYNGEVDVTFAIRARCEGCGQTAAFAPTGNPSAFSDDHLILLDGFRVKRIDFANSSVTTAGEGAFGRRHPESQVVAKHAE